AFSANGQRLFVGADDGTGYIYDVQSGKQAAPALVGHALAIISAAFSPDGSRIVTGSRDRTLRLWDAVLGTDLLELSESGGAYQQVWFTPDGRRIIGLTEEGTISIWDSDPDGRAHDNEQT